MSVATPDPTPSPTPESTPDAATAPDGGRCPCGTVTFAIDEAPLFRMFCHCTICQAFNAAPFADVTVFRATGVRGADDEAIAYRAWKRPPLVRRGRCRRCEKPAIERARLPLLPNLVIVPTANITDERRVPAPSMHVFYASRVADIDDGLPKHDGFASSQLRFGAALIDGLWRRRSA